MAKGFESHEDTLENVLDPFGDVDQETVDAELMELKRTNPELFPSAGEWIE